MSKVDTRERLKKVIVVPELVLGEAIGVLDASGIGVLLLCDADRRLVGILTDGDVRRAVLNNVPLDRPCLEVAGRTPLSATFGISPAAALRLMDTARSFLVNQLPITDGDGCVVDLWLRGDLTDEKLLNLQAVVMAGGYGQRLRPLTEDVPKPMLPVGGKPLMEHTIGQLRDVGIKHVNVATHFMAEKIHRHFGDGSDFGIEIGYVSEDRPLGTAGALGLVAPPDKTTLVINGDILTGVNFQAMLDFHRENHAALTVAVRKYDLAVPFGVLECEGPKVTRVREKPTFKLLVNAGIYLVEPRVLRHIPPDERFDMPDLIDRLVEENCQVVSFPIIEYWLDIGSPEDYRRAQEDVENGRLKG